MCIQYILFIFREGKQRLCGKICKLRLAHLAMHHASCACAVRYMNSFYREEREKYYGHRRKAKTESGQNVCIIIDGKYRGWI